MTHKIERYLTCPFCKLTKRGRAKLFAFYECLYHLKEEHGSDHVKVSGKVVTADDLIEMLCTLEELGVIKK